VNYRDALAWLYGTQNSGIKLGLDNTRLLLAVAGDPHERLKFLHIAGTNGKGSTCAMMDSILRAAGYRTGLYTSPHLVDFRERVRLDGAMIPEDAVAEGLTLLREAAESWDHAPTFFELATVLAAWWFAREGADYVVWETGMGGRLDATNAVTPLVSVITPIGMDHQNWLGDTLAQIAGEKAGIVKVGVPVVLAPQTEEARAVLAAKAEEVGAPVTFVGEPWSGEAPALAGLHQRWNAAVACAALRAAGTGADAAAVSRGLRTVVWPGRFQRVAEDLVIDGAHNPEGARAAAQTIREEFDISGRRVLVIGMLGGRDVVDMLDSLDVRQADLVLACTPNSPRAVAASEVAAVVRAMGVLVEQIDDVATAVQRAIDLSTEEDLILITGSLYVAGAARTAVEEFFHRFS